MADPGDERCSLKILPTLLIYNFKNDAVQVTLTFLTPALPDELDVLSWPLTYLTWDVHSVDGKDHVVLPPTAPARS